MIAGPGDDAVFGGPGDDLLLGGGGTDLLSGGLGEDELYTSDAARDLAVGGAGRDRAWSDDVDQVYVEVGVVIAKPIVFQRVDVQIFDSDVWSTNLDGSVQTNLTNDVGLDQADPAQSPFGTRIAYTQEEQDAQGSLVGSDIWVMNVDGSGATTLTPNTPGFDLDPAWSPDGTKIAFTSLRDGLAEIYVMNADGSNVTRLTFDQDVDEDPTWSPDGIQIAFTSRPFDGPGVFDVWVVNADGTGLHQLTSDAAVDAYPDWGPDGRIAWSRGGGGIPASQGWIWTMNGDGSGLQQIVASVQLELGVPSWCPDGTRLAAIGGPNDGKDIWTIDDDGTDPMQVTSGIHSDFFADCGG